MKCFSPLVTIIDNPLDSQAADACSFDGEGVPSRVTTLVQDGTVMDFLYDSYWANASGRESTGSSVRGGYRSTPSAAVRHLCLKAGPRDLHDELRGVNKVLKVTDIMGMHMANPITGEFSLGISGILMEGNSPLYPVREAAISGNMYELFARVSAIGTDVREFGSVLCPSILIGMVDVSAQ